MTRRRSRLLLMLALLGLAAAAAPTADVSLPEHPDVIAAKLQPHGANKFDFDVTVSSRWGGKALEVVLPGR